MKKRLLKYFLIYLAGFLLFFIFRLIYGFVAYPGNEEIALTNNQYIRLNDHQQSVSLSKKNYATVKYQQDSAVTVDQKYEKIATVVSESSEFESDEKRVRGSIKSLNALIQLEQSSGLKGNRRLYLTIGVPPDSFDSMIDELKKVGRLSSINIEKFDKTNEYKELKVKQSALERTRDALIELKRRDAKVEELVALESRILEIENEIQLYGVNLGEFDEENEFCTVNLTLNESLAARGIPLIHRIKVALEWSIKYYLLTTVLLFFGLLLVLVVIAILDKLKVFDKLIKKFME